MKYTHLGARALGQPLALGTMNFGFVSDEAASFGIMDNAIEAGINFFDTADVYGGPSRAGHGERLRTFRRDHRSLLQQSGRHYSPSGFISRMRSIRSFKPAGTWRRLE